MVLASKFKSTRNIIIQYRTSATSDICTEKEISNRLTYMALKLPGSGWQCSQTWLTCILTKCNSFDNRYQTTRIHKIIRCFKKYVFYVIWSKKTSKLCVTGLCAGNSPVTGECPAKMTSNAENVSIWWRHHERQKLPKSITAVTKCQLFPISIFNWCLDHFAYDVFKNILHETLCNEIEISMAFVHKGPVGVGRARPWLVLNVKCFYKWLQIRYPLKCHGVLWTPKNVRYWFYMYAYIPPPTPTTDQNVYHARTHFHEERDNFSKVCANSRNQEKGVIFQA